MKVRKKPGPVIEARQYIKDNASTIAEWCGGELQFGNLRFESYAGAVRIAECGDWILKLSEGFDVCRMDVFELVYERVE